ncbi:M56 family metallopeptidase [Lysobacter antibioticus]|uniref:BlaR1 peptidase M56 family protein n=1 Tax=Lysobacter antibioticus TaxID=84531 RepID=A0A0S2FFF0_LYSAN|nr:M56 family metallopeptidase [Lysobacter antibioticus]ALN82254.1 blaR1 peptidase M56 family protein [Lysobacter antibioticus]
MIMGMEWTRWLTETTVATSLAVLLVLAARLSLRRAFGAAIGYAAWALVPLLMIAVLLPTAGQRLPVVVAGLSAAPIPPPSMQAAASSHFDPMPWLLAVWLAGAVVMAVATLRQQRRFQRALGRIERREDGLYQAEAILGLPAAFGLLRPRIVVQRDFDTRYSAEQQALIRTHERSHIRRGDLHANALVALLRCVYWFNPLLHYAARRFRHDQELACDLRVLARHPRSRRSYGEAMLKTLLAANPSPLACHWAQAHPLKERILMLKQPLPAAKRVATGAAVLAVLAMASGFGVWAGQPADAPKTESVYLHSVPGEPMISLAATDERPREVAHRIASQAGLVLANPEALADSGKGVSLQFDRIPARSALELVAGSSGMKPVFQGASVTFVPVDVKR